MGLEPPLPLAIDFYRIVLINQQASIAAEPSGSLLHTFVDRLVNGGHL
jgi:hypothetical protein